jgi:hypothetical protein
MSRTPFRSHSNKIRFPFPLGKGLGVRFFARARDFDSYLARYFYGAAQRPAGASAGR